MKANTGQINIAIHLNENKVKLAQKVFISML